jgi:eukaryotic-like serine/threonine-protein kinase
MNAAETSSAPVLPANAPAAGSVFAERYRVERMLGVGGMGFVFAATRLDDGHRVAIKMLVPELSHNKETVARFMREARAAGTIESPHVVRVNVVGELPDRTPYMVMEYLDGADLQVVLENEGALPIPRAVDLVLEACEAIAEAHALGFVHRDLKPSNLFLARDASGVERLKVLDFGISKAMPIAGGELAMTKTASMLGSPLYMSPEHMKNARDVDERTDIWAIGVILFELIAGRPPFWAESLPELSVQVLSTTAPPLSSFAPHAPPGLTAAIAACLHQDREARFRNIADLADAMAPFATARGAASAARIVQRIGLPSSRADLRVALRGSTPSAPNVTLAMPTPSSSHDIGAIAATNRSLGQTAFRVSRPVAGLVVVISLALLAIGTFFIVSARRTKAAAVAVTAPPPSASVSAPILVPAAAVTPPAPDVSLAASSTPPPSSAASVSSSKLPPRAAVKTGTAAGKTRPKKPGGMFDGEN